MQKCACEPADAIAEAFCSPVVPLIDDYPLYNVDILAEYDEVLRRPRFPFTEGRVRKLIDMVQSFGVAVDPKPTGEILPDVDDLVFYEVVMEKRDDNAYLVTGNIKHFPSRRYIVTPAEMMEIIAGEPDTPS